MKYLEGIGYIVRWLLRSKIHKATVTQADLAYVGSITIDMDLIERVGLWPGEKVLVVSNTSGARLDLRNKRGTRLRHHLYEWRSRASHQEGGRDYHHGF